MSEYNGVLRVASTVSERRGWTNSRQITEGLVTTLHEQDGALRQVGQVGGLGRQDNESIRAVRFIEERGYIVTFRQTDPLYVLDLSNAAAPTVVGELKIPAIRATCIRSVRTCCSVSGRRARWRNDRRRPISADSWQSDRRAVLVVRHQRPASPRRIDTQTYGGSAAAAEFDPRRSCTGSRAI